MIRKFTVVALLAFLVVLGGCRGAGPQESTGGLLGAAAGGLLGAQFGSGDGRIAMAILGALAGSALGSHIGATMDEQDAQRTQHTLQTAYNGQTVGWQNPNSGVHHQVTPTRTYYNPGKGHGKKHGKRKGNKHSTPCREFTHTAYIGGKSREVYGTACRQADGSWKIQ